MNTESRQEELAEIQLMLQQMQSLIGEVAALKEEVAQLRNATILQLQGQANVPSENSLPGNVLQ